MVLTLKLCTSVLPQVLRLEFVGVCKDKNCIVNPGDNNCARDECKCPDSDDVCSHAFPKGCKLDTKAPYSCSGKGADPQK